MASALGDIAAFPIEVRRHANEITVLKQYGDLLAGEDLMELAKTATDMFADSPCKAIEEDAEGGPSPMLAQVREHRNVSTQDLVH